MKIVYTSGSWDLLHLGHVNMIRRSRELGDKLIVGVSTDELIEAYKGMKPIIPFEERLELVRSLRWTDVVVVQHELVPIPILKEHDVSIVTIGDDWVGKYLEGLEWMQSQGGQVVYLNYTPGISTTGIKKKILDNSYKIIEAQLRRENESSDRWARQSRTNNDPSL
ncbi:MAG: adenylyltransferase/cytidyltransferase family protein [Verrucomicrobiales bacterium]